MEKNKTYKGQPGYEDVLDGRTGNVNFLTLHNDDIHTFEYVIESLIEVCEHDMEQAEQCTYLIHYRGKCDVKKGNYNLLTSLRKELNRRGLTATID
jgi:ATP-dependent Clp protease adaptor protein ClpS